SPGARRPTSRGRTLLRAASLDRWFLPDRSGAAPQWRRLRRDLARLAQQLRRAVRLDLADDAGKDARIAGHYVAALEVPRPAGEVADYAARFLDQQQAGGHVPGGEADFPEAVVAAAGDIGKVQRRGARAADVGRQLAQRLEHAQIGVDVLRGLVREAGSQQGAVEILALGDADAAAIELGAVAAAGGPKLLAHGIVDHRYLQPAPMTQGDGDGEVGHPVEEIGGAVERIDDPLELVVLARGAGFLAHDGVMRVGLAQDADDL